MMLREYCPDALKEEGVGKGGEERKGGSIKWVKREDMNIVMGNKEMREEN